MPGCELFKPPPLSKPFGADETLPAGAHAYAQAYLDACLANGAPLGSYQRGVLAGAPIVAHYEHHTICNGSPGCCPAVTLLHDLAPLGTAETGVTPPAIDWPLVAGTAAAAGVTLALFWLALKHAAKARTPR